MHSAKQVKPDQTFREFWIRFAQQGSSFIALARDGKDKEVAREIADNLDEAELALKKKLLELSNSYIGIDGAINTFRKVFKTGFNDPYYIEQERSYKDVAVKSFRALAPKEAFAKAAEDKSEAERIGSGLPKLLNNDLTHTFEKVKLRKALSARPVEIVRALGNVLYGGNPWDSFDEYVNLLKPFQAASWPNVTYFPFLAEPSRWLFIKPDYLVTGAERLGWPLDYSSTVTAKTYRDFVSFGNLLQNEIAELSPKDFIDVHTFIFSVNKEGYVAEMQAARKRSEKAVASS